MSYRRVCFGFALPISLALACTACGNGNQPVDNQPVPAATAPTNPNAMAPNPNAGTPFNTPATGATVGAPMPATSGNARGFAAFNTLAGSKGYITQSDAMQDHWMNSHFQTCDADHDGKVTRSEYDTCTASAAAAGATAAPPPMSGQ